MKNMKTENLRLRWRVWRDNSDPKNIMRTDEVFDNWQDAAERCAQLNRLDSSVHWCRLPDYGPIPSIGSGK